MRILNPRLSLGFCNYSDSFHSTYDILFSSVFPPRAVNHNLLCCFYCEVALFLTFGANWAAWFIVICFPRIFHPFSTLCLFFSAFRTFRLRNVDGLLYLCFCCCFVSAILFDFILHCVFLFFDWNAFLWKICFLSIRQFNFDVIPTFVCSMGIWIIDEYIDCRK